MASRPVHLLATFLGLASLVCAAQSRPTSPRPSGMRPPDGGAREVLVSILIPSLTNSPFSATVSAEWVRVLEDGATMGLVNHRAIARDRAGRIFQERRMLVPDDGTNPSLVTQIEISDPVAHTLSICIPSQRTCQVETFSAPDFVSPITAVKTVPNQPGGLAREDLGKQTIAGLQTVGIRETGVIETGRIGNDNPIMIEREFWYSPQLGVNLVSKRRDPRFGTQNFTVSDIALGEPDMKLFQLPSAFKVIDLRK